MIIHAEIIIHLAPMLTCVVGLVMLCAASSPTVKDIGRIMYAASLLVVLWQMGGASIKL